MHLSKLAFASLAISSSYVLAEPTPKHEAGRCSIRGTCVQGGFFSPPLPCPDNGLAEKPSSSTREKLVSICGDKWKDGPVCCTEEQLDTLETNLQRAGNFISSCPACKANFENLFCTFTCSPNQSLFVNVTDVEKQSDGKYAVTELDNLWSDEYGSAFYDSCKDVKFGATGGKAMSFIGGGAENYTEFLKFLGHKNPPFGSPFQINFPRPEGREKDGMKASDPVKRKCNDDYPNYRCACVDCPDVCPELEPLEEQQYCYVGSLPCLSFASIMVYTGLVLLGFAAVVGHVIAFRYKRERNERLRLLQDAAPSDDEDEGDLVHNAGLLDRPTKNYRLNQLLDSAFAKLGRACARYPLVVIGSSIAFVGILSLGWISFGIETDPVRLWVSPSSAAAQEKAFFDDNFGSFYRVEQAFLVNKTSDGSHGTVLNEDTLRWWFEFEDTINRMTPLESSLTLSDICFNPSGEGCVVQSVSGYFPSGLKGDWEKKIRECTKSPGECIPSFGQPLDKEYILGGYDESGDVMSASALTTTWVVNSVPQDSDEEARVILWENSLRDRFKMAATVAERRGLHLSFSTEASLKEELNQSTNTDAKIIVVSYVIMFIYASFALGSASLSFKSIVNTPSSAFIRSKFSLGIAGIIIVLMSVSASVGLFSAFNVKSTLIIAEVIPFLVLAVGVDNIFLIVHEFERVNKDHLDELIETRMAKALGRMGPSILLSGLTETIAFALGIAVGMPAVRNFAIYATGAVFINALLQVTAFVSVLALNQRRVESNRIDCFPCVKVKQSPSSIYGAAQYGNEGDSWLQNFIRRRYAPFLLDRRVKVSVLVLFLGIFAAGVALLPEVQLGLDQKLAVPTGSYLIDYFEDLEQYYETGPPVYFITRDTNVTSRDHQLQLCGRYPTCETYSVPTLLEQESKRSNESYITGASAAWVDDFFSFLNPALEKCCIEHGKACFADRNPPWNVTLSGMPQGEEFVHYLHKFLEKPTDADCLGGKALYSSAIVIDDKHTTIPASYFRTFHTPLQTQEDFINSYASARRICNNIKEKHNIDLFPYSKHYIFFDQYASIIQLTGTLLGSALGMILVITSLLLGSVATGLVVTVTVGMILVDVLGAMAIGGVMLNALSLVNLVICVGIGVEFCAHVARAFAFPSRSLMSSSKNKYRGRDARTWTSLVNVGASVFSGITVTKVLGVAVLAFTRSKLFEIFYFRVWIALVAFAASHALILLPVLLSLVGGEGYVDPESDAGLEDDLAARRYRALLPEDEYDSDEY